MAKPGEAQFVPEGRERPRCVIAPAEAYKVATGLVTYLLTSKVKGSALGKAYLPSLKPAEFDERVRGAGLEFGRPVYTALDFSANDANTHYSLRWEHKLLEAAMPEIGTILGMPYSV